MLMILGTFRLPADKMDAGRPAMTRMVEASRAEDGCVEYVFAEDVADPGLIHVKERWVDQAALDRHNAAAHMAEWRAAGAALGIGERNLAISEIGEWRPL
ncbi:putative quinol monooxygenase [Sphingobium sp. CCH11-B1]|jgi:quinol monooxygenase YgiN|uniref:putative quinol monooxygenase n=1 Tax=Sphingobium sp. CCH11-B1 TaxID=1768781 RepID=UPI0008359CE7|nr:putative quinol monooxygenase [Sphingobium sp. CCH11-B1]MEA3389484.1 putative quinol monooxygenase [Pseudomonadota bacterium]